MAKPKKILFVCTGNTCRSPMAEAIFRQVVGEQASNRWLISSAGIHAAAGAPATVEALEVLKGLGLDASAHSARQLNPEALQDVDLILTMTVNHKRSIQTAFPFVADRVFTVKEYAGKLNDLDIHDPYGAGLEAYYSAATELQENLALVWKRLEAEASGSDGPMKLAIGCDHAAFDLKQSLLEFLDERGVPYDDFGTYSTQRVDYPDFGIKVAMAVANGEYQWGILCCGTGIGMSIVANKVKGIRASLCHDTYSARYSRSHNDANILCLGARVIGPGLARDILEIWLNTDFAGGRYGERLKRVRQLEESGK